MFYLYIDESGDYNNYLDSNNNVIQNRSKYFTLGGIIVNDDNKSILEHYFRYLKLKYFNEIDLPTNFKLHYHDLRQRTSPYDKLDDNERFELADEVFNQIRNNDCYLLSVTIDKEKHCKTYNNPANPLAYGLYIMLERFQYFLEEYNDDGIVIYEKYNSKMRKAVERVHKWLISLYTFPTPTNFNKIVKRVKNGDPQIDTILQYADFFAYIPWIKCTSNNQASRRYEQIKNKYYNLDVSNSFKKGNVKI